MEISENLIRQYEAIRQSGLTNMFDSRAVKEIAAEMDYTELADLSTTEYGQLLQSYSELMEKHNIAKDDKQIQMEVKEIKLIFDPDSDSDYDDEESDEDDEEWEDQWEDDTEW